VIEKVTSSPFCCGQNGRGWRATLWWLTANADNALKVLEGRYDPVPTDRMTGLLARFVAGHEGESALGGSGDTTGFVGIFERLGLM